MGADCGDSLGIAGTEQMEMLGWEGEEILGHSWGGHAHSEAGAEVGERGGWGFHALLQGSSQSRDQICGSFDSCVTGRFFSAEPRGNP